MPLFTEQFPTGLRFRMTPEQKSRLFAEARRRNMSGADLLRELIETLPEPKKKAKKKEEAA